jgi:hypothetical protein
MFPINIDIFILLLISRARKVQFPSRRIFIVNYFQISWAKIVFRIDKHILSDSISINKRMRVKNEKFEILNRRLSSSGILHHVHYGRSSDLFVAICFLHLRDEEWAKILAACFMRFLVCFFGPEDGGNMVLRNIRLSTNYTTLYLRKQNYS